MYFVSSDNIVDFGKIELLGKNQESPCLLIPWTFRPMKKCFARKGRHGGNWENTFYFLSLIENLPFKIELENHPSARPKGCFQR